MARSTITTQSTEFQLYKKMTADGGAKNIIDFTEKKLERRIENTKDLQQRLLLQSMLVDYISGVIAISWRRGNPSYLKVTKDK